MSRSPSLFLWLLLGILLLWVTRPAWESWFWPAPAIEPRPIAARGELATNEQAIISIFEQTSPSVVYITTIERVLNLWTRDVREIPSGTGTGFVWDQAGHIVTNHHVIAGHRRAKVRLAGQQVFDAVVVGSSEEHDLAVLRLQDIADLPAPVLVGSSRDLQVGQTVLAIGNPFGLDHTLTSGIISALGRRIDEEGSAYTEGLIQTDAAINPGNSGGPLLDSAGRVVGVNVAIYSPSGASAGIGFAIPIDVVNRVVPRLVRDGRYTRPMLGITMDDSISERITAGLNTKGVLVLQVTPRSPAARAGVRGSQLTDNGLILGDIIQQVDSHKIETSHDLHSALDNYQPNDRVSISLLRNGQTPLEIEINLTPMR